MRKVTATQTFRSKSSRQTAAQSLLVCKTDLTQPHLDQTCQGVLTTTKLLKNLKLSKSIKSLVALSKARIKVLSNSIGIFRVHLICRLGGPHSKKW